MPNYLSESDWSKLAKTKSFNDRGLNRALSAFKAAQGKNDPSLQLEALLEVIDKADDAKKKCKDDELNNFLVQMTKEGHKLKPALIKAVKTGERESSEEEGEQTDDDLITELKAARRQKRNFVLGIGKKAGLVLARKAISSAHKKKAKELSDGGTKMVIGGVQAEGNKYTFLLDDKPPGGLAKKIKQAVLLQTGLKITVIVKGGGVEISDEADTDELDDTKLKALDDRDEPRKAGKRGEEDEDEDNEPVVAELPQKKNAPPVSEEDRTPPAPILGDSKEAKKYNEIASQVAQVWGGVMALPGIDKRTLIAQRKTAEAQAQEALEANNSDDFEEAVEMMQDVYEICLNELRRGVLLRMSNPPAPKGPDAKKIIARQKKILPGVKQCSSQKLPDHQEIQKIWDATVKAVKDLELDGVDLQLDKLILLIRKSTTTASIEAQKNGQEFRRWGENDLTEDDLGGLPKPPPDPEPEEEPSAEARKALDLMMATEMEEKLKELRGKYEIVLQENTMILGSWSELEELIESKNWPQAQRLLAQLEPAMKREYESPPPDPLQKELLKQMKRLVPDLKSALKVDDKKIVAYIRNDWTAANKLLRDKKFEEASGLLDRVEISCRSALDRPHEQDELQLQIETKLDSLSKNYFKAVDQELLDDKIQSLWDAAWCALGVPRGGKRAQFLYDKLEKAVNQAVTEASNPAKRREFQIKALRSLAMDFKNITDRIQKDITKLQVKLLQNKATVEDCTKKVRGLNRLFIGSPRKAILALDALVRTAASANVEQLKKLVDFAEQQVEDCQKFLEDDELVALAEDNEFHPINIRPAMNNLLERLHEYSQELLA